MHACEPRFSGACCCEVHGRGVLRGLRFCVRQITWRWQGFANPARADGLQLAHWVKCYKDPAGKVKPADEGDYSFAKYNKKARSLQRLLVHNFC
jgi:DNA methyltransferase 1-associated protein 1